MSKHAPGVVPFTAPIPVAIAVIIKSGFVLELSLNRFLGLLAALIPSKVANVAFFKSHPTPAVAAANAPSDANNALIFAEILGNFVSITLTTFVTKVLTDFFIEATPASPPAFLPSFPPILSTIKLIAFLNKSIVFCFKDFVPASAASLAALFVLRLILSLTVCSAPSSTPSFAALFVTDFIVAFLTPVSAASSPDSFANAFTPLLAKDFTTFPNLIARFPTLAAFCAMKFTFPPVVESVKPSSPRARSFAFFLPRSTSTIS